MKHFVVTLFIALGCAALANAQEAQQPKLFVQSADAGYCAFIQTLAPSSKCEQHITAVVYNMSPEFTGAWFLVEYLDAAGNAVKDAVQVSKNQNGVASYFKEVSGFQFQKITAVVPNSDNTTAVVLIETPAH